jgi:hypothetical protein
MRDAGKLSGHSSLLARVPGRGAGHGYPRVILLRAEKYGYRRQFTQSPFAGPWRWAISGAGGPAALTYASSSLSGSPAIARAAAASCSLMPS